MYEEASNALNRILELIPEQSQEGLIYLQEEDIKYDLSNISKSKILQTFKKISSKSSSKLTKRSRKNWKTEQIQLLIYVTDKCCFLHKSQIENLSQHVWNQISAIISTRSPLQCMFKMLSVRKCTLSEYPWSKAEDQLFKTLVNEYGTDWDIISRQLFLKNTEKIFRNSKQCKQHYSCFYDPTLKKGIWTIQEDYLLASCFLQMGRKWSRIAKKIQSRNQNAIKNRFYLMFQNKKKAKGKLARDLIHSVLKFKKNCEDEGLLDKSNFRFIPQLQKHSTQAMDQIPQTIIKQSKDNKLQDENVNEGKFNFQNHEIQPQNFADFINFDFLQ